MNLSLRPGERLDNLGRAGLVIIQSKEYGFAIDAVLLAHFAAVRRGDRVLDLGCGGGVIPLLLAGLVPDARITGLDIDAGAVDTARRSVALNDLEYRIDIRQGDLRQVGALLGHGNFDVVTCNPPYRRPGTGVMSPFPGRALARHELECTLEDVAAAAAAATRFRGRACFVYLAGRLADLLVACRSNGLEPKRLRLVHPLPDRPAALALLETMRGGGREMTVLPPLVIRGRDGAYTREILAIYGDGGEDPK